MSFINNPLLMGGGKKYIGYSGYITIYNESSSTITVSYYYYIRDSYNYDGGAGSGTVWYTRKVERSTTIQPGSYARILRSRTITSYSGTRTITYDSDGNIIWIIR